MITLSQQCRIIHLLAPKDAAASFLCFRSFLRIDDINLQFRLLYSVCNKLVRKTKALSDSTVRDPHLPLVERHLAPEHGY